MKAQLFIIVTLACLLITGCSLGQETGSQATAPATEAIIKPTLTVPVTDTPSATVTPKPTATTESEDVPIADQPAEAIPPDALDPEQFVRPGCTVQHPEWPIVIVKQGDTLSAIARKVGSTAQRLAEVNCLVNPNRIFVSQQLRVPLTFVPPDPVEPAPEIPLIDMGPPPSNVCVVVPDGGQADIWSQNGSGQRVGILVGTVRFISRAGNTYIVELPNNGIHGWVSATESHLLGATCPDVSGPIIPATSTPSAVRVLKAAGNPPTNSCVADVRHSRPLLYLTANLNEPLHVQLENWAFWISTVGNFYQISFQTAQGEFVNGFVLVGDARLQGSQCPIIDGTPAPDPIAPVYLSEGTPPSNICIAYAGRTGPTLYRTANLDEPIGSLGNWGLWMSTVNSFHQITIGITPTQIVNGFVQTADVALQGVSCP